MNLPAQLFASDWLWLANFLYAVFLLRALRSAPWRKLLDNPAMVNALVGLLFGLFLLWQFNAGIRPGFNFHVLGATLFVLMFGWQIATAALSLVMLATWLRADMSLLTLGLNGLLMIALPVMFNELVLRFSQRNFPKNLFFFVLFNGFLCALVSIVLLMLASSLVLLVLTHYTGAEIHYHLFAPSAILMFVEGVATGMLTAGFTVAHPEAMMNFDVDEYLTGK